MAIALSLRFKTETQKKKIIKIAKKNNRSLNEHLLHLVDKDIEFSKINNAAFGAGINGEFYIERTIPIKQSKTKK
jgi:hypothetical protein